MNPVSLKDYVDRVVHDLTALHENDVSQIRHELEDMQRQVTEVHDEGQTKISVDEYNRRHEALENRMSAMEKWQANVIGRAIALAFVGAIFTASIAALITHLISS